MTFCKEPTVFENFTFIPDIGSNFTLPITISVIFVTNRVKNYPIIKKL